MEVGVTMAKFIVTDLDNTLLRSDKSISEYTISILKKCRSKGIKIVFATARSTQAASKFINLFNPDVFVAYGGALVTAEKEIIQRFDIPSDISNQMIRECLVTSEVLSILAINETVALTNNKEETENMDAPHYKYADFSSDYNYRYLKISLTATSQTAVEKIAANYPMCDMLRYTGEDLYRFAIRDAVKWNAVKAIAEHYNVSTDMFVAFGDDINDLEMIQKCGTGVAVKNAISEVQSAAKYICNSNDDDGVARWIEERIL